MTLDFINKILRYYDLEAVSLDTPMSGYRNRSFAVELKNGEKVNFLVYKDEKGILSKIKNANSSAMHLAANGMSVREAIRNKNGREVIKLKNKITTRYASLYNYLPGKTIPWEAYTMKHIKLIGKTLSDMHHVWEPYDSKGLDPVIKELMALNDRMRKYFSSQGVKNAMRGKLHLELSKDIFEQNELLFGELERDKEQSVLHMDFVRSNILFAEGKDRNGWPVISGILDFEKVAYGPRIVDIARTLAFLIVDCKYKDARKVQKYFLRSGYDKRGKSKLPDLDVLEDLLVFYWLHDFYKFLLHNPYESLKKNEHFVRTREKLEARETIALV